MSGTDFSDYSARKKQLAGQIIVASLAKSIEIFSHRFSDGLNIASFARQAEAAHRRSLRLNVTGRAYEFGLTTTLASCSRICATPSPYTGYCSRLGEKGIGGAFVEVGILTALFERQVARDARAGEKT